MSYTNVNRRDFTLWERSVMAATFNRRHSLSYTEAHIPEGTFNSSWQGGSKDVYWWATREGRIMRIIGLADESYPNDPFGQSRRFPVPHPDAVALVQGGTFCGKQSHLRITLFPPLSRGDLA